MEKVNRHWGLRAARSIVLSLIAVCFLVGSISFQSQAQHSYSKTFPATRNIRLQLNNWSGSVVVETWNRDEVKISAKLESNSTHFTPEMNGDSLVIDVGRDNRTREDIGNINFTIRVPVNSNVDLETRRGNITVRDIQGALVRARISLEGDIDLTGIRSTQVMAENTVGNITFDGELLAGGTYRFSTAQGDISIILPASSRFKVVATAPLTKSIDMGSFMNRGLNLSDGRRVTGAVGEGDGQALLTVTNYRGTIKFFRR
jgi:DUF4097 and DUF4098 domain-containing protein YvlB